MLAMLLLLAAVPATPDAGARPPPCAGEVCALDLPGGAPGIGFDDLRFAPALGRLLVPAGRSGMLDLVDPTSLAVTSVRGFTVEAKYGGGHDQSVTSADEGAGFLFATDRDATTVSVIDPVSRSILGTAKLRGSPDYVRFVEKTRELWVTEPDSDQIEIFGVGTGAKPSLTAAAVLAIKGGPESLVVDQAAGRVFTHLWQGKTLGIDARSRQLGPVFSNGCVGSRGIALDTARGWVIASCAEGRTVVLEWKTGEVLSMLEAGKGLDVIDYDPRLRHVYVAGATSASLEILGVSPAGKLSLLRSVAVPAGTHCVATDGQGRAYVCAPKQGQLVVVRDRSPAVP